MNRIIGLSEQVQKMSTEDGITDESWKNWTEFDVHTGCVNKSISEVFDDSYYSFSSLVRAEWDA